jgi:tripartite-type tricarboxylate transporter receptor subunit TctC
MVNKNGIGEARRGYDRRIVSGWVRIAACAVIAVSLAIGSTAASVNAQSYPNKPVRFILPFPPGGPTDMLGRLIGQKMSENLGQPFVPENRPGAGGNVGMEIASQAPNDGYSIVLTSPTFAISPTLYKKMNYDPVKDFAPISLVAEIPQVLLVRPGLPVKSLAELVKYAKANPGKLKFGSGGMGTTNHLASEYFKAVSGIDMLHVPYKGSNQAMLATMSNEVDMVTIGIPSAMAHIQSGKVRALAVLSTTKRLPELPDLPTTREAGIDNFDFSIWYAILAPAGTPKEIVARLNGAWVKIASQPEVRQMMKKAGFEALSSTPEEFAEFGRKETIRYGKAIRETGLKID